MLYESVSKLSEANFKRIVGVKRETFELMLKILSVAHSCKHKLGGRPNKSILENQLLMTLCYWREYRTYAHIGISYGYSESQVCRIIKWCEDVLIKSGKFNVLGKKELITLNPEHLILIDATESPIQRPKKINEIIIQERKKDIQ